MARHDVPDFRDRMEHAAFSVLLAALRGHSVGDARRRGRLVGRFAARAIPLRRRVALDNLARAFPERSEAERRAVHAGMCENLGQTLAEFARFDRKGEPDRMDVEGSALIAEALSAGRGALLLTAHFGNWELLGAELAARGFPMTVLGGRQRNPLVEDVFSRLRERRGLRTLTVGKSLRPLVETFAAGRCVATLADQDGGPDGFFVDFLGRPASVQAGLFRLIARRGIPLITGFAEREGEGWRAVIHPPVFPLDVDTPEAAETEARRLACLYSGRVEEAVRRRPDHWFWVHRRWKSRPDRAGGSGG